MFDPRRLFNVVEKHVGRAEHVRQWFLLYGTKGSLHERLVFRTFDVGVAHVAHGAGQEAAGSAGRIHQDLARMRVDLLYHEGGDGTGSVVFASVARVLKVVQQLFVKVAEVLAFGQRIEIDLVDLVDHLPHERAGFHVVVGVLEYRPDHLGTGRRVGQVFESGEQVVIHEIKQVVASNAFGIGRPRAPLQAFGDGRSVVIAGKLQSFVLIIDDLEEKHPDKLR